MIAVTSIATLLAQAPSNPAPPGGAMFSLLPIFLIVLVFYFLMWRPQSKRQQEHQSYLSALKSGDEVVTAGGILGTVRAVDGNIVTLEISKGTKIKVLKANIRGSRDSLVAKDEPADSKKDDGKDKEKE